MGATIVVVDLDGTFYNHLSAKKQYEIITNGKKLSWEEKLKVYEGLRVRIDKKTTEIVSFLNNAPFEFLVCSKSPVPFVKRLLKKFGLNECKIIAAEGENYDKLAALESIDSQFTGTKILIDDSLDNLDKALSLGWIPIQASWFIDKGKHAEYFKMPTFEPDLINLLATEDITHLKRIGAGHVNMVYRAQTASITKILKVAFNKKEELEIKNNVKAYLGMKSLGMDDFIPQIFSKGNKYLLLEDLGQTFRDTVRCELDYKRFCEQTDNLFRQTVSSNPDNVFKESVANTVSLIENNIANYGLLELVPEISVVISELRKSVLLIEGCSTFASWDFTPENVFTKPVFKIIDIKGELKGCPIMGLAGFAGLCRNVIISPSSEEGYIVIQSYCINELSTLLRISKSEAIALFCLGTALQLVLGARFRKESNRQQAIFLLNKIRFLKF